MTCRHRGKVLQMYICVIICACSANSLQTFFKTLNTCFIIFFQKKSAFLVLHAFFVLLESICRFILLQISLKHVPDSNYSFSATSQILSNIGLKPMLPTYILLLFFKWNISCLKIYSCCIRRQGLPFGFRVICLPISNLKDVDDLNSERSLYILQTYQLVPNDCAARPAGIRQLHSSTGDPSAFDVPPDPTRGPMEGALVGSGYSLPQPPTGRWRRWALDTGSPSLSTGRWRRWLWIQAPSAPHWQVEEVGRGDQGTQLPQSSNTSPPH